MNSSRRGHSPHQRRKAVADAVAAAVAAEQGVEVGVELEAHEVAPQQQRLLYLLYPTCRSILTL